MPVILHHMGMAKPWRLFIRHRHMRIGWYYYGLYRDFLKDTPWRDWLAGNWTFGDFTRNLEWELVESVRRFHPPGRAPRICGTTQSLLA